jgi:hypothetical protein
VAEDKGVVEGSVEETDEPIKVVKWDNKWQFQSRELSRADLLRLGAKETEKKPLTSVEWNQANGWTVPRDSIPLSDLQLGVLLGSDHDFRLADA